MLGGERSSSGLRAPIPMPPPTHPERIKGGLFGLLIGYALGVPYEFHPAREIPPFAQIEMDPPHCSNRY